MAHLVRMRTSVNIFIRTHVFKFTTESMMAENLTRGRHVRKVPSGILIFQLTRKPRQERSRTNVRNVATASVGFQVFKPIRGCTAERSHTNPMHRVRVSVKGHSLVIRESLLERIHTNISVRGVSGKTHIVKRLW
jgi:hypothetical protein